MSLRLEMLQVARLAQKPLKEVKSLVYHFLCEQIHSDGGFKDRSGNSDLYYTVFGIESLHALQEKIPVVAIQKFIQSFTEIEALDLVHLSCLVRIAAAIDNQNFLDKTVIIDQAMKYRASDGGFHVELQQTYGSAYGNFLVLGILQDMGMDISHDIRSGMISNLQALVAKDGGYANMPQIPNGNTTATAAAICVLQALESPIENHLPMWLMNHCVEGGFCNNLTFPVPDLLSTATVLHALSYLKTDITVIAEAGLDFVDSLWTNRGGFYGSWTDDILDTEYTYYGLLALGHLSLWTQNL